MLRQLLLTITVCIFSLHVFSQTGSIKGMVKDAKSKEGIVAANVLIKALNLGVSTDIEGNFMLSKVPTGTYTLSISYVSYKNLLLENIKVEAGKVTNLILDLEEDSQTLGDVVVTAQRQTNSIATLTAEIKTAQQVAVGVSAEQIAKSQDRDASQVVRRVPGVSLIDNRFVMVRGLGQRYNAVMINGVLAPSSEVDTRAFSFDLMPSNVIEKMMVYKSGSGDLPGEFAGGVIQITTRTAPEENFTNFSMGSGYRSGTTFNNVFAYKGSKTDILGFDNGQRALPTGMPNFIGSNISQATRLNIGRQLQNNWELLPQNASPDIRASFSMGRRFKLGKMQLGNFTAINYSNTKQYLQNATLKTYQGLADGEKNPVKDFVGNEYSNNIRIGLLHNWSLRLNKVSSVELKTMFNQMATSESVIRSGLNDSNENLSTSLRYETRSILNSQLIGKHNFDKTKLKIDWVAGFSYINKQEPDWRRLSYTRPKGSKDAFQISLPSNVNDTEAARFFSNLHENVYTLAASVEKRFGTSEREYKIKAGIYAEKKVRDFAARRLGFYTAPNYEPNLKVLPLADIFTPEHINPRGLLFGESTNKSDKYDASNLLAAAYINTILPLTDKLTLTMGLRAEHNTQNIYNTQTMSGEVVNVHNPVLSLLPSLNVSYDITEKSLLRFAYSRTINRPEFREIAPFVYYNFNLSSNIYGNETLKVATADNVDLRWELYPSAEETLSFGAFYKKFTNPIESYLLPSIGSDYNYGFGNAKSAISYGLEAEIRKSLSFIADNNFFKSLSIYANASLIYTQVDLGEKVNLGKQIGEVETGKLQNQVRPMLNQSPYLINSGLYYNNEKQNLQVNILYNIYGKRIFAVGNSNNPTIYEMPRHTVDLSISKGFGKMEIRLGIQNLLNQTTRFMQDANFDNKINGNDLEFRSFKTGTYATLDLAIKF